MPIYTLRVRMRTLVQANRGGDWCEMTHHFHFPDDESAEASLDTLIPAFNDSGITVRWVCVRGALAHQLAIYRRSEGLTRLGRRIGERWFDLPEYQAHSEEITMRGVPVGLSGSEAHIFPAGREAVTVIEQAPGGARRRVFVGPVSPCALWLRAQVPIVGLPMSVWVPGLQLDFPYDPSEDLPNIHRLDLAEKVRDHVHGLADYTEGGYKVIVRTTQGTSHAVQRTWASLVKAQLSSRSSRGPRTESAVHSIVPV